ncbi:hypothetical protein AMTRI_Chr08g159720 [Amborella trichopoda]
MLQSLVHLNIFTKNLQKNRNSVAGRVLLEVLDLSDNNILSVGFIANLGKFSNLKELQLSNNIFRGTIPPSLGNLSSLTNLILNFNSIFGCLPEELSHLTQLEVLHLTGNILNGTIPPSISNMFITCINGSIPATIGQLRQLEALDLSRNNFSGEELDLSSNNLQGQIPMSCQNLKAIEHINLFYESFVSDFSFVPAKPFSSLESSSTRRVQESKSSLSPGQQALCRKRWFGPTNLIGSGSFGSIYRRSRGNGTNIAVTILHLKQDRDFKSFVAECEALCGFRHRNLSNDFKALIEHSHRHSLCTGVPTSGLSTIVVHCDLKPSNILLDKGMSAHVRVRDFSLARILPRISLLEYLSSMLGLKGSIGYIPPEYGFGNEASTNADVYGFGILLLKMFTGKKPTDEMFANGLSLCEFVNKAYPNQVMEIMDLRLCEDIQPCLVAIMKIGLSSKDRIGMRDALNKLQDIKNSTSKLRKLWISGYVKIRD